MSIAEAVVMVMICDDGVEGFVFLFAGISFWHIPAPVFWVSKLDKQFSRVCSARRFKQSSTVVRACLVCVCIRMSGALVRPVSFSQQIRSDIYGANGTLARQPVVRRACVVGSV